MNYKLFLILSLILFSLPIITKADDSIYSITDNKLKKDSSFTIIFNENIKDLLIDATQIYAYSQNYLYIVNKSSGVINYKVQISNIKNITQSDNYIYVKSVFVIYKVDKINGNLETKFVYNNPINNFYTYFVPSSELQLIDFFLHENNLMCPLLNLTHPLITSELLSNTNGNNQIANFTTCQSLGITSIPTGIYQLHLHSKKTGVSKENKWFFSLYIVNSSGGYKRFIANSTYSLIMNNGIEYSEEVTTQVLQSIIINSTDKLYVEIYINQTGVGDSPNIFIYYDDASNSRLILPLNQLNEADPIAMNNITSNMAKWDNSEKVNKTNASELSGGTLSDSRLSTNVPLLNATNIFTTGGYNSFGGGIRVTGVTTPATNSGIEFQWTGIVGNLFAFNRTSGSWVPMFIGGANLDIFANAGDLVLNAVLNTGNIIFKTDNTDRMKILNTGSVNIERSLTVGSLITDAGENNIYVVGDVSALTFTDRTPYYDGDALTELNKIKGLNGEINHATLPSIASNNGTGRDLGMMVSILTKAFQQQIVINKQLQTQIDNQQTIINKICSKNQTLCT